MSRDIVLTLDMDVAALALSLLEAEAVAWEHRASTKLGIAEFAKLQVPKFRQAAAAFSVAYDNSTPAACDCGRADCPAPAAKCPRWPNGHRFDEDGLCKCGAELL